MQRARSANERSVRYYRENEWAFNKDSEEEPPALCLAMSGGGMRSAAFSIGVLAGLHDTAPLLDPKRNPQTHLGLIREGQANSPEGTTRLHHSNLERPTVARARRSRACGGSP